MLHPHSAALSELLIAASERSQRQPWPSRGAATLKVGTRQSVQRRICNTAATHTIAVETSRCFLSAFATIQ